MKVKVKDLLDQPGRAPGVSVLQEASPQNQNPEDQVPFGPEGARFMCNLLQHGVFLGIVVLLLMVIGYFGSG